MNLPIRLRLTIAFAGVLVIVLAIVGIFVFVRVRTNLDQTIDTELRARATTFFSTRNADRQLTVDLLGLSDERFGQVLDRRGEVVARSAQLTNRPIARATVGARTATVRTRHERRSVRLLVVARPDRTVILATALDDRDDALGQLRTSLLWGAALTFVLATALAWVLARAALRPVERLRIAAGGYTATDLTGRLREPPTDDEIRRLAVTLNAMLGRIQDSFERQRGFVDRASHEIRTPLANLSLELELALRGEHTQDELRAALVSAADETHRLSALASNLLLLARTTDGSLPVVRAPVDLAALLTETVDAFAARAAVERVDLVADIGPLGSVSADPTRVRQAVTNLLDNALRVTPPGGTVTLVASDGAGVVAITVVDTGPGFDAAMRADAFGTFVRGGTAASADGAGLGLAIVAAIAVAHDGTATIDSVPSGASVTMTLSRTASGTSSILSRVFSPSWRRRWG